MAQFEMHIGKIENQYNYAAGAAPGDITSTAALRAEIERLVKELAKAHMAEAVSDEAASDAKALLRSAAKEAEAPEPDKSKIAELLGKATAVLKDLASVAGLYKAVADLAQSVPVLPF